LLRDRPRGKLGGMYDAIVIGARCGGSPTAMLLARQGWRVLLLDRAAFPSDIGRLHYVRQPGIAMLQRWGLLPRLRATGCPPIRLLSQDAGDFPLVGTPVPADGVVDAYGPRRRVLDGLLVEAAVAAGVELRERFVVEEVLCDGDRVTGIRGRAIGGATVTERARVTIGADGMRSIIARTVGAPIYHSDPTMACWYYSYWSGLAADMIEIYWREGRDIIAHPTNDDLTCVVIGWPIAAFEAVRHDVEASFMRALELVPSLAERAHVGRREEHFGGIADLPSFFRKPYGPGWALVGDAGYHKDPFLAHGISDAFRDAQLLADALERAMAGGARYEDALGGYQRARDAAVAGLHDLNVRLSRMEPPPPEVLALRAAIRGDDLQTSRYMGAVAGTIPFPDFFGPENVARLVGV
jgi:flavin-dependent dehydrogenase